MNPEQLYDQAQQLLANKQHNEAYKILKKLDASIPNHPGILYLLAACQSFAGNKENAVTTYQRVLKLQPGFVEAMNNMGLDLKHLGRYQDALAYFDQALTLQPSFFDAQLNKASTLLAVHEDQAASDILIHLLGIAPDHPMVLANLGTAHLKTRNPQAALEHFSEARRLLQDNLEITRGYLSALSGLKRWETLEEVAEALPADLAKDPTIREHLFASHLHTCKWEAVGDFINEAANPIPPLYALCTIKEADKLRACITAWSHKNAKKNVAISFNQKNTKIKLGFISTDFKSHPVAFLTNGIFGHHDTDTFEVHGIAIDRFPPSDNQYRQKIASACHHFHEVGNLEDRALISHLRSLELDILVDLNGYTDDCRTAILSERCAPLQVQYLGFPGTMGSSHIDYIIGDSVITPPSHFKFYSEKIISLPECFQANDDLRKISPAASRTELGLPEDTFIYACFNQQIKLTQQLFDSWLRILGTQPRSLLWLASANTAQVNHLQRYTESQGISAGRLIFAERVPYEQHLGRYAFADLVLDTFPFNGGTTTSDALWGGAPVLTMVGDAYGSRMSASLLHSVGLDALITKSSEEYESLAIELASNPERLRALRQKLHSNLISAPVFNTKRFVKHLEQGLTLAVERHRQGLKPDHISVPVINESTH